MLQQEFVVKSLVACLYLGFSYSAAGQSIASADAEKTLTAVDVTADRSRGEPSRTYSGGQTARGGRLGVLGEKDFLDTPFATSSYTSELIRSQSAKTAAEVLANDPAVRFITPAGHMVENFYIRGFAVTADNMAMNGLYGVAPYGHIPTEMIERLEIHKGPSAMVNGMSPAGAIGGSVNVVTKKAGAEPLTRVGVDFTSRSRGGTSVDVSRRYGENREIGIRFNGAYRDGGTELDGQSQTSKLGALALDYRGDKTRIDLDYFDNREQTDNGSPFMASFGAGVVAPPKASTNLFKGTSGSMDNRGVALRAEHDLNDNLSAFAAVGARATRYRGFIFGTAATAVSSSGAFNGITNAQIGYIDGQTLEAGVRSRFSSGPVKHELVLAANTLDFERGTVSRASSSYASNIYAPAVPLIASLPGNTAKTQQTTLTGVALADTLHLWGDALALTVGLRNQRILDKSYSATTGAQTAAYDKTVTTPGFGLVAKPWSYNLALYANYIEGLAKGATAPASGSGITVVNANQAFAPYVSTQREVGVKWDAGAFAHTFTLYQISEPMMVYSGPNTARVYTVDGQRQIRGAEWTVMGQVARNVRLLGGATFAHSAQKRTTNGVNDGKDAYGVPDWQGNLGLEWDTPWASGLTLSGRVTHTASQYLDYANTTVIPSWTRFDAGARYQTKIAGRAATFSANVSNLFNKDYWVGAYQGEGVTTISAPRTFSLRASVDL